CGHLTCDATGHTFSDGGVPFMKSACTVLIIVGLATSALNAGVPSPADYDVYRGKVAFKNLNDHMLGILVFDEKSRADGYVHLFRLWTDTTVNPISVAASASSVEYRGRELVVMIPDKQLFYTFVISDAQFTAP